MQVGVWVAPVRTGHAEVEQELRPGVYRPRVMSFMLSEVKGKPEAQWVSHGRIGQTCLGGQDKQGQDARWLGTSKQQHWLVEKSSWF